jgi:hypothetical protein
MAIWTRFMAGLHGFSEAWTNADPQRQRRQMGDFDSFGRFDARQFRYDLFWGCYQNNVFRELAHSWAPAVKETFGLYRHTRNIFNPVGRLVEFHATHLHGGRLDPAAGDGETVKSAIPILTDREAIRPALARLWRDSKMQVSKAILDRFGACLGDVGLKAVDDPIRRRVTLQVVHPGHVKWADWDDAGDVKEYIIEEVRFDDEHAPLADMNPTIDPRSMRLTAIYSEEAVIEGGRVRYRTFKNGSPHNWRGRDRSGVDLPAEWTVPYRFVPLVLVQHKAFGDDWGMGEPHGLLSKAFEVDDQASGLGDQIRKAIRAPKFISGVKKPREQVMVSGLAKSDDDAEPDRHGQAILYGPEGAQVFDMTFPLDIVGVGAHIDRINAEIERDFPELAMDIWGNGDTSGRALKVARQRVESKIQERRPGYDAGLVRVQQYALAIAALRGYPDAAGLPADPDDPGLAHEVAHRPVFSPDPLDDIDEGKAFWEMAGAATKAGMPLELLLEREGWDPEDIAKVVAAKAQATAQSLAMAQAQATAPAAGSAQTQTETPTPTRS